jgi:2,5-diamino-6-(ribosylamino)-4(3H)-pyrimidinone 5'-phosphate reductase
MATERPHLTVYNEISLDGKITGFDGDGVRYYARGFRWRSDAILMGSVTAQAFGPDESAAEQVVDLPALAPAGLPPGFAELVQEPRPLLVVPDSGGRLRNWRHARAQPWYGRIVVLVAERTPTDYLEHLDRRGIEHLTAGDDRVDLALALHRLSELHAVRSIRTDSGGALNGALLAAGLVDRIAVIVAPRIGSDPEAQVLIRLPGPVADATSLRLVESEVLDDGALWLVYAITPTAEPVH